MSGIVVIVLIVLASIAGESAIKQYNSDGSKINY